MKNYRIMSFESNTQDGLDTMVNSFLEREPVELINVSLTSCSDQAGDCTLYIAAIAYSYED